MKGRGCHRNVTIQSGRGCRQRSACSVAVNCLGADAKSLAKPSSDKTIGGAPISLLYWVLFVGFFTWRLFDSNAGAAEEMSLKVGFSELGAIRVGMTRKEAEAAYRKQFGGQLRVRPFSPVYEDESCYHMHDPKGLPNVAVRIKDGKVVLFDIASRSIQTFSGIGIGDTMEKVQSTYGNKIQIESDHYEGKEVPNLWLRSADGRYAVLFKVIAGNVSRITAGRVDAVSIVEGC